MVLGTELGTKAMATPRKTAAKHSKRMVYEDDEGAAQGSSPRVESRDQVTK